MRSALAALAVLALMPAQAPQSPRAVIVGKAIDGTTGQALSGVVVSLMGRPLQAPPGPPEQRRVMVDENGGFAFVDLPAATYTLVASLAGYADGAYGRTRPGGAPLGLAVLDGARLGDIRIRLWKLGAIVGTVTDEANEPLVGVRVRALVRRSMAGRRKLVAPDSPNEAGGVANFGSAMTDDRGMYRIGALVPGEYVLVVPSRPVTVPADVASASADAPISDPLRGTLMNLGLSAKPGQAGAQQIGDFVVQSNAQALGVPPASLTTGALMVYPTTFSGDAASARQAKPIVIGSGEVRSGVDVHMRPVSTVRVSGVLTGPSGPIGQQAVRLMPTVSDEVASGLESAVTVTNRDGSFVMLGVTPGQYTLRAVQSSPGSGAAMRAVTPRPTDQLFWVAEPVTVANQDVRVNAVMREGLTVRGRFSFFGSEPPTAAQQRVPIVLEPAEGFSPAGVPSTRPGQVEETGAFTLPQVAGGRYLIRVGSSPNGWALRSIVIDGQDVSDTAFELKSNVADVVVNFTNKITSLSGTAHNAQGAVDPDALVVLFSADQAHWLDFGVNVRRLKSTRPASTGAYSFNSLPAGDYFLAALPDAQADNWRDPDRLAALSRVATRVHLNEGDSLTQELRTVVVR